MKKTVAILCIALQLWGIGESMSDVPVAQEVQTFEHEAIIVTDENATDPSSAIAPVQTALASAITNTNGNKIALLVPQEKIEAYAGRVSKAILAYLLMSKSDFEYEVFNTHDEEPASIKREIANLKAKGFTYVIAVVTEQGAGAIYEEANDGTTTFYIPTLRKEDVVMATPSMYFGGISYKQQFEALAGFANPKVINLSASNRLGAKLDALCMDAFPSMFFSQKLSASTDVGAMVKVNQETLTGGTVLLNTPTVTASLLLSQMQYYGLKPYATLSTQLNYSAELFTLTQPSDTKGMYVANSISRVSPKLENINAILGNDIRYNWIDYAASIGTEYYMESVGAVFTKLFNEPMTENQVLYDVYIEKPQNGRFIRQGQPTPQH